jgi:hypothetical protein
MRVRSTLKGKWFCRFVQGAGRDGPRLGPSWGEIVSQSVRGFKGGVRRRLRHLFLGWLQPHVAFLRRRKPRATAFAMRSTVLAGMALDADRKRCHGGRKLNHLS